MKKILVLMLVLLVSRFGYAETVRPDLTVNGIMLGSESMAIVNDKFLKEGDVIEGAKVIKINDSDVEFHFQGETFTVVLTEASAPKAPSNNIVTKKQEKLGGTATNKFQKKRILKKVEKYLSNAANFESQAKDEFKDRYGHVSSVPSYDKAVSLYESAIKENKYALNEVFDEQKEGEVRVDIERLGVVLDDVKKEREVLHKKIQLAIRKGKVVLGMTEEDAFKSNGGPLRNVGSNAQSVYFGDDVLYFDYDGILYKIAK